MRYTRIESTSADCSARLADYTDTEDVGVVQQTGIPGKVRNRDQDCEAGVRTGGRKLEGSKREADRNGCVYPALLVEYDDVLAFLPRVCCVF